MLYPLTCGIIIESPKGWLLGRLSSKNRWDLPKGKKDEDEHPLKTALRECLEETGIDFSTHIDQITDLGAEPYARKKEKSRHLHLFLLKLDKALDLNELQDLQNKSKDLEMDTIAWIDLNNIENYLSKKLLNHLSERGLISSSYAIECKKESLSLNPMSLS